MTTEFLTSSSITNLNASPPVSNTTGEGAGGVLLSVTDTLTATTGKTAGSQYRLVRFPTGAKVKHVFLNLDGSVTTFTADILIAFSNSAVDGTLSSNQGTIPQIASANNNLFGASVDLHAVTTPTDYVAAMGGANRNKPMWKVLGYSVNPGGFFDLMLNLQATTSGAPVVTAEVQYVD